MKPKVGSGGKPRTRGGKPHVGETGEPCCCGYSCWGAACEALIPNAVSATWTHEDPFAAWFTDSNDVLDSAFGVNGIYHWYAMNDTIPQLNFSPDLRSGSTTLYKHPTACVWQRWLPVSYSGGYTDGTQDYPGCDRTDITLSGPGGYALISWTPGGLFPTTPPWSTEHPELAGKPYSNFRVGFYAGNPHASFPSPKPEVIEEYGDTTISASICDVVQLETPKVFTESFRASALQLVGDCSPRVQTEFDLNHPYRTPTDWEAHAGDAWNIPPALPGDPGGALTYSNGGILYGGYETKERPVWGYSIHDFLENGEPDGDPDAFPCACAGGASALLGTSFRLLSATVNW